VGGNPVFSSGTGGSGMVVLMWTEGY
jgi:hypothetical protein